jgi:uncharacterized repeat protein (TIGR01451 family)
VLTPVLTIIKSANVATANPSSTVSYQITVTDSGQTSYAPAVVTDNLSSVLDDATYNSDAGAPSGTLTYASPNLTWSGNLSPGQTVTITYSATVLDPETGDRTMTNTVASAAPGSTCPAGSTSSACVVSVSVVAGALTITAPGTDSLGSSAPGTTLTGSFGTVQVIDSRGFGANWTATVGSSAFTTGTGTGPQVIPPADIEYLISAFAQTTGPASFSFAPDLVLNSTPQTVVTATNVQGNTTVTWNPLLRVHIPPNAVAGTYAGVVTHSVS